MTTDAQLFPNVDQLEDCVSGNNQSVMIQPSPDASGINQSEVLLSQNQQPGEAGAFIVNQSDVTRSDGNQSENSLTRTNQSENSLTRTNQSEVIISSANQSGDSSSSPIHLGESISCGGKGMNLCYTGDKEPTDLQESIHYQKFNAISIYKSRKLES